MNDESEFFRYFLKCQMLDFTQEYLKLISENRLLTANFVVKYFFYREMSMMTFSGSQGKTPWKQWNNFLEGKRGSNEGPINHNKLSICPFFVELVQH